MLLQLLDLEVFTLVLNFYARIMSSLIIAAKNRTQRRQKMNFKKYPLVLFRFLLVFT